MNRILHTRQWIALFVEHADAGVAKPMKCIYIFLIRNCFCYVRLAVFLLFNKIQFPSL